MLSKTKAKYIQSLDQKKFRDEYRQFVAEGPKLISDLIQSKKFRFNLICATAEWMEENNSILNKLQVEELITVANYELDKISQLKTPNKVLAILHKAEEQEPKLSGRLSIFLDEIQDPGNMGTILRIADWFAIKDIICSTGCVDVYNGKVIQATMGSIARVSVVYRDPLRFFSANKIIQTYAATLGGKDITKMNPVKEGILIIGNEGRGIDPAILAIVNHEITIPRFGNAESLNAAVSSGILLSHMVVR